MENCLVTKLKESVNNDNLEIFGKLRFTISEGTNSFNFKVKSTSSNVMTGSDGLVFSDGGGNYDVINRVAANVSGKLIIPDKYDVTFIDFILDRMEGLSSDSGRLIVPNSSCFEYLINLKDLGVKFDSFDLKDLKNLKLNQLVLVEHLTNSEFYGDLTDVAACMATDAIKVDIESNLITGDLSDIGVLTEAEIILNGGANITGSLHNLGKRTYIPSLATAHNFTYTGTRPIGSYFLITGPQGVIRLTEKTDVENFLIDQATLDFAPRTISQDYFRNCNILCEGVSVSDLSSAAQTALNTIKTKEIGSTGTYITVKLNGVVI